MKTLQEIIPAHTLEAIGATLMHSIWQLAGLSLLLALLLAILPSRAYKLRYSLATITLVLMVVLPFATFGWLHEAPAAQASLTTSNAAGLGIHLVNFGPVETAAASLPERIQAFFQSHASELMAVWLVGAGLLALRFLLGCWKVYRLRNSGLQAVPADLATLFADLSGKMGIRRQVSLHFSKLIDTPAVVGAFKPMVLLPMGLLSGLSMEQLEYILVHELGHVRRLDYAVNILQSIAEIAFFYHPGIWWLSHLLREERENCCDEIVLEMQGNKVQYAKALLNLEVFRQAQPELAVAATDGNLKNRILRITGMSAGSTKTSKAKGLLFALLTFVGIFLLATQSQTVVKAAMPFFQDEAPQDPQDLEKDAKSKKATLRKQLDLSSNFVMDQDSPVKKVIIQEDEETVELQLGPDGEVIAGKLNGKEMSEEEKQQYGNAAKGYLHRMPPPPSAPGMPPMPPMPRAGTLPPMPPIPGLGQLPALPPMPQKGEDFDSEAFEKQMEKFGEEMERWGEQFAQQFEGGDWKRFEKDMEVWGEDFGKQMESWGKNFEKEIEAQDWEAFGAQMEAWGESLGDEIERRIEIEIEEHDGPDQEDAGARRREVEEEREIIMLERDRKRAEADRLRDEAIARRDEAQAARDSQEERKIARGAATIAQSLEQDGLVKPSKSYKLTISEKEMILNGKKQSEKLHQRYMDIVGRSMGLRVGKDEITISHKAK